MRKVLVALSLAGLIFSSLSAEVYAKVDGEEITDKDLMFLRQAMPNLDLANLPSDLKDKAIDQAIERKLLTREAKKDKQLENTQEYKDALEAFKDELILGLWTQKQFEAVQVSDSEVKKHYNANKDKLIQPETAKARHILVATEKEAKDIIAELNKAGKNAESKFAELAKAKSADKGSAEQGGELPPFAREGQMVAEFSKAAFALKPTTYTKKPVKTDFGYHIIYLKSIQPKGVVKYEDIKPQLENDLKLNKIRDIIAKRAQDLKKKAKIEMK
ncbi:peptidyl-prolyl cis-trans isomerase [Helicobacter sp. 23-1044]